MAKSKSGRGIGNGNGGYDVVLSEVMGLLEEARRSAARSVNAIMTATYWEIGRRIVEFEQRGKNKAEYGKRLIDQLSQDLTKRFGRGFGRRNLFQMRSFYCAYCEIVQSATAQLEKNKQNPTSVMDAISASLPLSWTHYVKLLGVRNAQGRAFYETEALRNGWTVRQLTRQIDSQFYERTALSRNKKALLESGAVRSAEDRTSPEEGIKDPFVLEFLEIGNEWFRVDLLFFHRRLRCLVVIDLKLGKFTLADAGQMHFYLNYARENWTNPNENPPVGLILCAQKNAAVAHYALDGLPNKVMAAEYITALPAESTLEAEVDKVRKGFAR